MRDGRVRRGIKRVARWNYSLNLWISRAWRRARGEQPFLLGGACHRCARCCEAPAIRVSWVTWYWPALRRLFLWWQDHVNGWQLQSLDREGRALVFKCTHFDWEARSCDSYDSRPAICRDYPLVLMAQPQPEMLPGCGYRPVALNARKLGAALDLQPMTAVQRAKLRRNLFLDE